MVYLALYVLSSLHHTTFKPICAEASEQMMDVALVNDGPVTIELDTDLL